MNPVSSQKTGSTVAQREMGRADWLPPPGDSRARDFLLQNKNNNKNKQREKRVLNLLGDAHCPALLFCSQWTKSHEGTAPRLRTIEKLTKFKVSFEAFEHCR